MMVEKPKIQYVREFYNYGSTAKKLDLLHSLRLPTSGLPTEKPAKAEAVVLDPVAIVAIVSAIALLIAMAVGLMQIQDDWAEHDATAAYVSYLNKENARLTREYQAGYDLEEIRSKAIGLGLVPVEDVQTMTVTVTMPIPEKEPTWQEKLTAFWDGLWA